MGKRLSELRKVAVRREFLGLQREVVISVLEIVLSDRLSGCLNVFVEEKWTKCKKHSY